MARILVTGGVGFIGYHVTRALLARGDDAIVVDDFSDRPYPRAEKLRNESDLQAEFPGVRVVRGCVTDGAAMAPLVGGAEAVLHLAGLAGVRPSFGDPVRYARVNVEGTAVVQEHARAQGIERFLFASSSSVYGNATPLPAREDAPAVVPESPYAASKRAAELVASSICRNAPAMRCTALRFFTVYGPRQRPEMAITRFMRAALAGQPVHGLRRRVDAPRFHPRRRHRARRRRSARRQRLPRVPRIQPRVGSADRPQRPRRGRSAPSPASRCASRPSRCPLGDVDAGTFADIGRAREELGWAPQMTLREGLATVLEWVREHP